MIMRFLLATLLTTALSFIAGIYLPWWSIAIVSFLIALLIVQPIGRGFLSGFAGIFILWGLLSLWIDLQNESILSHKIAQVIPLGGSSVLLILITALLGAIVGGFGAMAGSSLAPAIKSGRQRQNFQN
jgi:hypothetical protein